MRFRLRIVLIALAMLPGACAVGCTAKRAGEEALAPATTPRTTTSATPLAGALEPVREMETCSTRSEANFPAAFDDPGNLVVGPFVLVGAALPTSAAVVESLGGQKHQVLVRAGHEVTLRVPTSTRTHISLGYGSLPEGDVAYRHGHPAVAFVACRPEDESGSSVAPGHPVTFWSGFVCARKPSCAPLDVHVDGEPMPHRIQTPLGAAC